MSLVGLASIPSALHMHNKQKTSKWSKECASWPQLRVRVMRGLILFVPFRNDSYLKGNRGSKVCALWTSTTGESLLTQLSKLSPPVQWE